MNTESTVRPARSPLEPGSGLGAPKTIEFGLKLPEHMDIVAFARRAEALDVDYVFQGEHVFFHGPVSNSLIDLSFAAAATERLKLLSSATLVPLYPAALLAKLTASLAVNSRGRFNLGVGVGGDFPPEFEACGVPIGDRGRATNVALDLMMRLWRGEPIGPFESSSGGEELLSLDPLPPGRSIPIWVCGRSSATLNRAVRVGDWWMPYLYSIGRFRRDRAELLARSHAAGRRPPQAALHSFAALADSKEEAISVASRMLATAYGQSFEADMVEKLCIAGTSDDCAEQISEFMAAGAEAVCFNLLAEPADYDARMDQLCADVLPKLRGASDRQAAR
jgi:alkanesulfonate monooxygenase SsuD/methylene tetrahydromethanopterin reductase-like flavin-dependent oxidoreductase (luciferase family)